MSYLMESKDEAQRLLAQEEADLARERFLAAGLKSGDHALDAGCGPGGVAAAMADVVGAEGSVLGIDLSAERLAAAQSFVVSRPQLRFQTGNVLHTGLEPRRFDFVWSQFVLQYLPQPGDALSELMRVTRQGGTVCVSEVDGAGLWSHPISPRVEQGLIKLQAALATTGFDPYSGRKMFSHFRRAGLENVRVRVSPFYVHAGRASDRFLSDWETRFRTIRLLAESAFGGPEPYQAFVEEYLGLLRNPDALKYAVVLVTFGTMP